VVARTVTPLTTVLSVVGSNTDTVAAGTNFGSNDPAYIAGDQGAELNEVSSIATNVITWKRKRLYADSIGAVVKEMTARRSGPYRRRLGRDLGRADDQRRARGDVEDAVAYISVGGELTFRFGLLGFNIENFQTAFGAPESVQGTGTPADPYRGAIGRAQMGGQGLLCIKFTGLRKDGYTVELDAVGCSITGSPTANVSGKTARPIPVEGRCLTHVINVYK
jgi:hypothetical protein